MSPKPRFAQQDELGRFSAYEVTGPDSRLRRGYPKSLKKLGSAVGDHSAHLRGHWAREQFSPYNLPEKICKQVLNSHFSKPKTLLARCP